MDFTLLDSAVDSVEGMATGTIAIINEVVISVWPVLIGLFLLVGVFFWLKRKAMGIAR